MENRGNESNRTQTVVCLKEEIFHSMTRSNKGKKINLAPSTLSDETNFKMVRWFMLDLSVFLTLVCLTCEWMAMKCLHSGFSRSATWVAITDLPTQLVKKKSWDIIYFPRCWCIAEKSHAKYSSIHITCTDSKLAASIGLGEMYLRCLTFLMKYCSSFCLPLLPLFLFHRSWWLILSGRTRTWEKDESLNKANKGGNKPSIQHML